MIIDEHFKDRVSSHLSQKIIEDALNGRGFFARNVLESIRLLEGMKVAPSTLAMRHQERELKGALAGFHHIHVSEDNFTRAFNAYRQKEKRLRKIHPSRLYKAGAIAMLFRCFGAKWS